MGLLSQILRRRKPVLFAFHPDATVAQAIEVMADEAIGIVAIVEQRRLIGVFSERDLLRRVTARGKSVDITRLRAVMTPDPVTGQARDSGESAIAKMQDRGCRHLPIVDGDGEITDMLSMRDLLREELRDREDEIHMLQDYIQHGGMQSGQASGA